MTDTAINFSDYYVIAQPPPSFDVCAQTLNNRRMPSTKHGAETLRRVQGQLKVVKVARELRLMKHEDLKTLACQFDADEWCEKALELILRGTNTFNENDNSVFEEEELRLYPYPMGLGVWCETDITDLLCSEIEEMQEFSKEASLDAWWLMYFNGVDDEGTWERMIEYFNWPFAGPVKLDYEADREKVIERLKQAGHAELIAAVNIGLPDDDQPVHITATSDPEMGIDEGYDFTAQDIRYLRKEARRSAKMWGAYCKVARRVALHPDLLGVLAEALSVGKEQVTTKGTKSTKGRE